MELSPGALSAFTAHVLQQYPQEAAGVLAGAQYVPCDNVADNPLRDFAISAEQMAHIELQHGRITAILHSHPYDRNQVEEYPPEWPSGKDMESWLKGTRPWGIAATDGEGLSPLLWMDDSTWEPLEGREYKWGVNDCFTVIRDYFRQEQGFAIKNYPRSWGHWLNGQSMYDDLFGDAGFTEVDLSQATVGDVLFFRIRNVSSHAGVITGPDTFLHHHHARLSGYDSVSFWSRQINKVVRYTGDKAC